MEKFKTWKQVVAGGNCVTVSEIVMPVIMPASEKSTDACWEESGLMRESEWNTKNI